MSPDEDVLAAAAHRLSHRFPRLPNSRDIGNVATAAPIRQGIESIFWTLKDQLGLKRHNARSLHGLRARIASKLLALAAGVWLNHQLARPTRAFADLSR
ncbi:MAG: transposase [Solirubrobacteraceae bacterium]